MAALSPSMTLRRHAPKRLKADYIDGITAKAVHPLTDKHGENSLTLHGNGHIIEVLRLALGRYAPTGGAQDDKGLKVIFMRP
jgi:hypothetical protein